MVESESEAKRRKAEARILAQKKRNDEAFKRFHELPEDHFLKRDQKQQKRWGEIIRTTRSHPRNKTLTIVCETSWNPSMPNPQIAEPLTYLDFRYVAGDPKLPEQSMHRNLDGVFGLVREPVYLGKPFRSENLELIAKLTKKGALAYVPVLLCPCGREVRFASEEDFLECVKVILILRLKEVHLSLFQNIKDRKGMTRS